MDAPLKKTVAILLMAGTGARFGSPVPKQFHRLGGKKIYQHTLDVFLLSKLFDEILLVCPPDRIEQIREEIPQPIRLIAGASTRQESSCLGLLACHGAHIVCIHDAVRPFITSEILKENIDKAREFGAVDTCIASTDTLVYAPEPSSISSIPNRADYQRGQTPQTFQYPLILEAHRRALEKGIINRSDDCSLVLDMGHPVHVTAGSEYNIKITTELDLCLAEQIFRLRQNHTPVRSPASLEGNKYIVTGGTGGIGKALCEQLKQEGALPIPLSRSSTPYTADLTSYASALAAFEQIHQDHGPVNGLINSIGELKLSPLADLSHQDIESQISANLKALIFCCKYAFLHQNAHIVNIASSSYARGRKDFTVYSSAKAAVVNFTQGLAEERPDLHINAMVPQRTLTNMRLQNFPEEDPDTLLDPSDVAREIIALLKQSDLKGSVIEIRKKLC
jgi:2-C-methyl-D-erythritol 4-phosphate cytidylyltransferase